MAFFKDGTLVKTCLFASAMGCFTTSKYGKLVSSLLRCGQVVVETDWTPTTCRILGVNPIIPVVTN